jgi:HK97 family phage major capsid protein
VSKLAFAGITLRFTKVANIVVMTDELVRFSNPSAEAIVRDDLAKGVAQFLDQQFTDPSVAAVTNVSPASITNGAPHSAASGGTADDLRADIKTVLASFSGANIPAQGIVVLMQSNQAAAIAMMMNPLGQQEFGTVTPDGGTLFGYQIVVSDSVPAGDLIFLKPSEILLADDGTVTIDVSREASLQLDSAPSEPPTTMVSLWQQNMVGIRAERYINWLRRRTESVYYLTGADYGSPAS